MRYCMNKYQNYINKIDLCVSCVYMRVFCSCTCVCDCVFLHVCLFDIFPQMGMMDMIVLGKYS